MASSDVNRRLNIYINDKEVTNSLSGISRAMSNVQREIKNLDADTENYEAELQRLGTIYQQLSEKQNLFKKEIKAASNATSDITDTLVESTGALSMFFNGLKTGNFKEAQEGLVGITSGFQNATKASLAFITTPIGIFLAGFAAFAAGVKLLFDYNSELTIMDKKLKSLGVAKPDLSNVRSEILATAKTFDKSFDEIAEKANSLSKAYSISISQANDIIAQGLTNGGDQNKDFLNQVGEYSVFFANAGYAAQDFINVINTGYTNGTYLDKLPDAIKEAELSLKDPSKKIKDNLVNAFGETFTEDILQKIKSGETTTKEALQQISTEAEKAQLNQQQFAQLTSAIFISAGEDVGGAAKIFDLLTKSSKTALSETAKATDDLRLANERYEKALASVLEVSGFDDGWTKIKTLAIDILASIIEELAEFKTEIQPIIDIVGVVFVFAWQALKVSVVSTWEVISGVFKLLSSAIKTLVSITKKYFQGDFKGLFNELGTYFINFGKTIANVFIGIDNAIINTLSSLVSTVGPLLSKLGIDIDKLKNKIESWKKTKFEVTSEVKTTDKRTVITGDAPVKPKSSVFTETEEEKKARLKAAEEAKKLAEQRAKEIADLQKQLLTTQRTTQDAQLALMADGYEKERALLNVQFNRKIEDLKAQLIKETELKQLETQINSAKKSGNTTEAARLQQILTSKLEINKAYNDAIIAAEQTKNIKLGQLEEKYLQQNLKKKAEAHQRELKNLQTTQNFELQEITSFAQAKALLSKHLTTDELKHVRTLEDAKKKIKELHVKEQYELEKAYLIETAQQLQAILDNNGGFGFELFSDEEKEKVLQNLDEVAFKLSNLKNPNQGNDDPKSKQSAFDKADFKGVDVLGFDAGQWEVLFNGLDEFKDKLQAIAMVSSAMQNAFGQYFAFLEAGENRTLANFEKSINKKKAENARLLELGYINQEVYNARIARDEAELDRKKAEIEYKQAKRKKAMAIADTIINTSVAIMKAYAQLSFVGGSIAAAIIGTLGALQIATINRQPLPDRGYKKGGYTSTNGSSDEVDGLVHKNEYVIPTRVLYDSDPRMPVVMDYLESKRTGKPATLKNIEGNESSNSSVNISTSTGEYQALVAYVLKVVNNNTEVMKRLLDGDISAFIEIDVKSAKKIRAKMRELESLENSRIK